MRVSRIELCNDIWVLLIQLEQPFLVARIIFIICVARAVNHYKAGERRSG